MAMTDRLTPYLAYLRYEKRSSEHTVVSYQNDIVQFTDFLQDINSSVDLLAVTPDKIRAWVIHLAEEEITSRSINRKLSALRSFYHYHTRIGNISNSPMDTISAPKLSKRLPCFLEENETETLFGPDLFSNTYQGWRDRTIIELFYATGIRISELINLTFDKVNLYDNTIKVLGKRNKEREIPFGNTFKNCYQSYVNFYDEKFNGHTKSSYIFVTDKANKVYPKFVY